MKRGLQPGSCSTWDGSAMPRISHRHPEESVGQFGTGFVTTYQLSEKVEIRSVLKEDGLPYKNFSIVLDRSGKTQEELHEAIENVLYIPKYQDNKEWSPAWVKENLYGRICNAQGRHWYLVVA